MGLIVPSGFCSETNTDSQARHTATILDSDSDLLITYGKDTEGYHHCSKVFWLCEGDTRANRPTARLSASKPTNRPRPCVPTCSYRTDEIANENGSRDADFRSRVGGLLDDDDRLAVDHGLLVRGLDRRVESVAGVAEQFDDLAVGGDSLADFDGSVELEVL